MKNIQPTVELNHASPTAFQILNSLRVAVIHNEDDVEFKDYYSNEVKHQVFALSWFDYDIEQMVVIYSKTDMTRLDNEYNGCYDYDIDYLNIYKITIGDGIHQLEVAIPDGLNEHTLKPLLDTRFAQLVDKTPYGESSYVINLLSETSRKRGANWIMIK